MVKTQLLKEKISASGLRITVICKHIGISRCAFYSKINNRIKFRASEIYVLSDLLKLSETEKADIFFGNNVN